MFYGVTCCFIFSHHSNLGSYNGLSALCTRKNYYLKTSQTLTPLVLSMTADIVFRPSSPLAEYDISAHTMLVLYLISWRSPAKHTSSPLFKHFYSRGRVGGWPPAPMGQSWRPSTGGKYTGWTGASGGSTSHLFPWRSTREPSRLDSGGRTNSSVDSTIQASSGGSSRLGLSNTSL